MSKDMRRPKYILYLRVSTIEQNSDLQRRELVEHAERSGWDFEILEDKATGKNSNRPALKKLLTLAAQRKIDGIAVWRADRLFRSLKEAVITLSNLTEQGTYFYSHKDGIDLSTSHGRLLANLLFSLAEFEAELTRSRVMAGIAAARARGVRLGRPSKVDPAMEQEILRLRQEQNLSFRQIARRLGISKSSALRVVQNPISAKEAGDEE